MVLYRTLCSIEHFVLLPTPAGGMGNILAENIFLKTCPNDEYISCDCIDSEVFPLSLNTVI